MIASSPARLSAVCLIGLCLPQIVRADPTFEVYGQLNFGLFHTDDGRQSETYFTDNDNSNTRIGFNWAHDYGGGRTILFNFETSLGLQGSSQVNIDDTDLDPDYSRTELRKFELVYTTPDIGRFSFGQGGMATDGSAEADFSGTTVIAYSGIADLAGGFEYRDTAGNPSGVRVGDTFKTFDGSRKFRVRYDTPADALNGLVFSIAGGEEILDTEDEEEYYDIAAKYVGDYGALQVDTRLGYSWVSGGEELLLGSLATLHQPTGLSLALSSGAQQVGDDSFIYAKVGWQQDWFSYGKTAMSVDVFDGEDYNSNGSDSRSVGLALVQNFDAQNLEIYAAWRRHDYDAPGSNLEVLDTIAIGARLKF